MMCNADVTASLVPTVAKQIQSVEPVGLEQKKAEKSKKQKLICKFKCAKSDLVMLSDDVSLLSVRCVRRQKDAMELWFF